MANPDHPGSSSAVGSGKVILSFDVGIRHLAYCVLRVPSIAPSSVRGAVIERWDMIDLESVSSVEACCKRLTDELHARFAFEHFDIVLVERQPKHRSIMMVAIQMFICCYFNVARAVNASSRTPRAGSSRIRFMHASCKLACHCEQPKGPDVAVDAGSGSAAAKRTRAQQQAARYKENKRRAVATCTHYLTEVLEDYANAALLEQYPKKDDLCDAFLQAVAFVEDVRRA